MITPPWTMTLTGSEHDLILFGLVTTALALIATLVRIRFASSESLGSYRTASLTANAVVAIAAMSYVVLIGAFLLGYNAQHGVWVPTPVAELAWSVRYMDWCVTVPLLVVELMAVGAVPVPRLFWLRSGGIALALVMIGCGYLGGVVIDQGRNFATLTVFGLVGAACFAGLYAIVLYVLVRSTPVIPPAARPSLQAAVVLLLAVWLIYPIVYGLQGSTTGAAWAVVGQLALCGSDTIAKIGFGTLIHRTAVLRSRADEEADPETRRPRPAQPDPVWVNQDHRVSFDFPPPEPQPDAAATLSVSGAADERPLQRQDDLRSDRYR